MNIAEFDILLVLLELVYIRMEGFGGRCRMRVKNRMERDTSQWGLRGCPDPSKRPTSLSRVAEPDAFVITFLKHLAPQNFLSIV